MTRPTFEPHTYPVVMHATFYGGPADGGELMLTEPLRQGLTLPMPAATAAQVLASPQTLDGGGAWLNTMPGQPSTYRLRMTPDQRVVRDTRRRVIYDYVRVTTTPPKETPAP